MEFSWNTNYSLLNDELKKQFCEEIAKESGFVNRRLNKEQDKYLLSMVLLCQRLYNTYEKLPEPDCDLRKRATRKRTFASLLEIYWQAVKEQIGRCQRSRYMSNQIKLCKGLIDNFMNDTGDCLEHCMKKCFQVVFLWLSGQRSSDEEKAAGLSFLLAEVLQNVRISLPVDNTAADEVYYRKHRSFVIEVNRVLFDLRTALVVDTAEAADKVSETYQHLFYLPEIYLRDWQLQAGYRSNLSVINMSV